ncbi:MAG: hypothetical protein BWZ00_01252 [Bacteroidetes bacterium ADurb.BinA174]|nr:MAG: hypothetical protein BWZ00_01252 [Bacteroidetes bacterium ADurb.BinA174]
MTFTSAVLSFTASSNNFKISVRASNPIHAKASSAFELEGLKSNPNFELSGINFFIASYPYLSTKACDET